jgi:hypothetical protein
MTNETHKIFIELKKVGFQQILLLNELTKLDNELIELKNGRIINWINNNKKTIREVKR